MKKPEQKPLVAPLITPRANIMISNNVISGAKYVENELALIHCIEKGFEVLLHIQTRSYAGISIVNGVESEQKK